MRKKHTTENAGGASAVDDFASILEKAEDLASKVTDAMCLATMLEERLNEHLFPGFQKEAGSGLYYFADIDKKMVGFNSHELQVRSEDLNELADDLYEALSQLHGTLKQHCPLRQPEPARSVALEDVIADWERAYAAWTTNEKDGGIPNGTPESKAEEAALAALVRAPCLSPKDVQRKASLFFENEYLRNLASDYTDELLASFKSVEIF